MSDQDLINVGIRKLNQERKNVLTKSSVNVNIFT